MPAIVAVHRRYVTAPFPAWTAIDVDRLMMEGIELHRQGRSAEAQNAYRRVIARRPEDVDDRDLSWLDGSWVADLSQDGRLLLFTEGGQGGGPTSAVYVRGTDGSAAVRLGAGRAIALSPDTRWAICLSANPPSPYLELLPTGAGEPQSALGLMGGLPLASLGMTMLGTTCGNNKGESKCLQS